MATKKSTKGGGASVLTPIQEPAKRAAGENLVLQLGMISVPIKLHAGARASRIGFNQLHEKCLGKLKMNEMHCPTCDTDVPKEEIVKGYEFRKDTFVLVTPEELEAQKPESSKVIEIEKFVDANTIDPIYLERSHYMAPGDGGARGFILIREVMRATGKVAIAKAVLSGQTEHLVLIRPYGDFGIALHTLFYQEELKSLPMPVDQIAVTDEEMKLAGKLVSNMAGEFSAADYRDEYAHNVKSLVAAKFDGSAPKMPVKKVRRVETDLLTALTASVKMAGKKVA